MIAEFTLPRALPVLKIITPVPQAANALQQTVTQTQQAIQQATATTQQQPFQPGTQHTGTVIAQSANGRHTLQFADGRTLDVQAGRNLPVGAKVTISITQNSQAQITNLTVPTATTQQATLANLSAQWPTFQNALQQLKTDNPQLANKLLQRLPFLGGKNMLPSLLAFSSAVGEGALAKFLGADVAELLQALSPELADDLSALRQLTAKEGDNWRFLVFPYMENDEDTPHQGHFAWRHQEDEDGHHHTRFVINAQTQATGPVQLDGLLNDKDLTLKLRLHRLPEVPGFEEGLKEVAQSVLAEVGLTGRIALEVTTFFSVDPLHDVLKPHSQLNVKA